MTEKQIFFRKFIGDTSGTTAVEFSFVVFAFLAIVFMIFEMGRIYWTWNGLQYAVENTTRYAMVNPEATESDLQEYVRNNMPGLATDVDNPDVTVTWEVVSGVNFVKIDADYEFNAFSPLIPTSMDQMILNASSRMAIP